MRAHANPEPLRERSRIADRISAMAAEISPAEQKVARVLSSSAMIAGLESVATLAERAGVSAPTVTRLATRLGYGGFSEFKRALLQEMEDRGTSPLSLYHRADANPGDVLRRSSAAFERGIEQTFVRLSLGDFEKAVALLTDPRRSVRITGGRFSQLLAQMLFLHLVQIRANVTMLGFGLQSRADQLLDVGAKTVLVAYDFRRYEAETVTLVEEATARGAAVIVITDPWNSPAARNADAVLAADVSAPSPFDSMVPATALTEALIGEIVVRLGRGGRTRMQALEELRVGYEWHEPVATRRGGRQKQTAKSKVRSDEGSSRR